MEQLQRLPFKIRCRLKAQRHPACNPSRYCSAPPRVCAIACIKLKEGLWRKGLEGFVFPFSACAKDRPRRLQHRGPEWEAISCQAGGSTNPPSLGKQSKDQNNWEMMTFSNKAARPVSRNFPGGRKQGASYLAVRLAGKEEHTSAQCG